ncbi:hypothetical protein [Kaistella palustris]|uniref:hypothetical protein n=1 Tax=Kaistella palustris TaxID=493376 RepID=UPI0012EBA009|nr:hypothetical protein [Kaistella palustris]
MSAHLVMVLEDKDGATSWLFLYCFLICHRAAPDADDYTTSWLYLPFYNEIIKFFSAFASLAPLFDKLCSLTLSWF